MTPGVQRVASWLQPEDILVDVPLRDATDALQAIASAISARHALDADVVLRALSRREQAGSTGLGGGFAIPHARIAGIDRPLTLLLRARQPIRFKAPDGEPVSVLLAILVPEGGNKDEHLQLLALVAELFSRPGFRTRIDQGVDRPAIAEAFQHGISQLRGP